MSETQSLSWLGIVRLGLVQTALGSIVVLTTSTLNRVMVVELMLPAMLPGALVGLHYAMQILRPRLGYGSDVGGRRTPWIIGGMCVLSLGGVGAALATAFMATHLFAGIALAALSFSLIGLGVGSCGTSLLVLLAKRVDEGRRGAAAAIVWLMMIAGFAITAGIAGHFLDPFSLSRLVMVTACVCGLALLTTACAIWRIEGAMVASPAQTPATASPAKEGFGTALAQVWAEPKARRFAIFIFVSMLAYGAQDLILDPFAGLIFGLTPGGSTKLSGLLHGGVLIGMLLVGCATSMARRPSGANPLQSNSLQSNSLQSWAIGGCIASAFCLMSLAIGGFVGPSWPLRISVFLLGIANGTYAIAAIGSMMALVGSGQKTREGLRMGLWGAAQGVAFGLGGFAGTIASDVARYALGAPLLAYALVFTVEAALFLVSAILASRVDRPSEDPRPLALNNDMQNAGISGGSRL
jgi:BCD family chlorophyll transporter-like MFS transporter